MVDCSGTLILKVWKLLSDTQEDYSVYKIAEELNGYGNRARIKRALEVLNYLGLVRIRKKGMMSIYYACVERDVYDKTTRIVKEVETNKLMEHAINVSENPKDLLTKSSLDNQEVKNE
jgi:predicted transcriptional regulator